HRRSPPRHHWTRSPPRPTPPPAPPCTPSTCPAGSGTPNVLRKPARNSPTPPGPRQHLPGNPRSPYSPRACASTPPRTLPARKEEPPRLGGAADRGTARRPRRDTRAETMPARHLETDLTARAEHQALNTPGSLKHLKYAVLGPAPDRQGPGHREPGRAFLGAQRVRHRLRLAA